MTRITSCCRPTRRTSGSVYLLSSRIRREEVERDARAYATGAAASLLRRRVGDGDVVQAAHETLGVVSLLLDPPGVHHAHDIVDGDGRLGDVGGEHNLDDARGRAHKHPSLFLGRERAVQGQDPVRVQAKPPAAGVRAVRGGDEELANVINLSDAGKKDEDGVSAGAGAPSSLSRSSFCAVPRSHESSRAPGSLARAASTSPSASLTNHVTSSTMS